MKDELLPYYEEELTFIRQMAGEFRDKYPAVAGRLLLEPNTCEDPHVERLIEAFALLTGRVRHKLDDEFPEITESVLDVLYPHYLRPIPSQAIVQFRVDPSASAVAGAVEVPKGTAVHSKPDDGEVCLFQTCYPVKIWPIRVTAAALSTSNRFTSPGLTADTAAVIRIKLECLGGTKLSALPVDALRFYLNGESAFINTLYETLLLNTIRISVRNTDGQESITYGLPPDNLRQVGFARHEGALPYSNRSFLGYRLLQEYFSFPEKFFFYDLTGFGQLDLSGFGNSFELLFALKEGDSRQRYAALEQAITADTFQLGCTPIVNLFSRAAEPIRVSQTKSEYRVIADQHHQLSTEIYSVDSVTSTPSYEGEVKQYSPFYSLRHGQNERKQHFWSTHRRPSFRKNDSGTEVYLSLVDLDFQANSPEVDILDVRVTCTNRDAVRSLRFSEEYGELQMESSNLQARCIRKPTPTLRLPMRRSLQWRLISHLSLNHLSIVDGGREALQEILRLYDYDDDPVVQRQIAGIVDITSKAAVSRIASETGITFCRGTDVNITLNESEYIGTGMALFGSVLSRFLALYSAINSFSRLTVQTSKGVLKQWPTLAGEQILL